MKAIEVFERAMDLMDEREDNGTLDAQSVINYKAKAPGILTIYQNELLREADYFKTYEITNNYIKPLDSHEAEQDHNTDDIIFEYENGFKAYTFECNSTATVYIEEFDGTWQILEQIDISIDKMSYQRFHNKVTSTNKMRIRFAGDYFYKIKNLAVYKENFNNIDNIPRGGDFIRYELPTDFNSQHDISKILVNGSFVKTTEYQWLGKRTLLLPKKFNGTMVIEYRPTPPNITDLENDDLVVDDVTSITCLSYALATELMIADENPNASYYNGKYEEARDLARRDRRLEVTNNEDVISTSLDVW